MSNEDLLPFERWSQAAAEWALLDDDERELLIDDLEVGLPTYRASEAHWLHFMLEKIAVGDSELAKAHGLRCADTLRRGKEPIVARLAARLANAPTAPPLEETLPIQLSRSAPPLPFREGSFQPPPRALEQLERAGRHGDLTLPARTNPVAALPFGAPSKKP